MGLEDNVKVLLILSGLSVLNLIQSGHKRKDDLFLLRFKFFLKANDLWGPYGFLYHLKWLWIYKKQKRENVKNRAATLTKEEARLIEIENDQLELIQKRWPEYFTNTHQENMLGFESIYNEARFLFDKKMEKFLRSLRPGGSGALEDPKRFEIFEPYWYGIPNNFSLQFDNYLSLTSTEWPLPGKVGKKGITDYQ